MTDAKSECKYLVRTLVATMLDLSPDDRTHVLRYLIAELERFDIIEPSAALAGTVPPAEWADLIRR